MILAHFHYNNSIKEFNGKGDMNTYIADTWGVKQNNIIEHDNGAYVVLDIINRSEFPRYERIGYYEKYVY